MEQVESVFKNKNYLLTFLGALVSNIGAMLLNFAASYYILKITNDDAFIQGAYLFACGLTFVVCSLFTGALSDRFNKAKIMYLCDFIKGGIILLSALIIFLAADNITLQLVFLFVFAILNNIIAAVFSPASSSLLPFILKDEQLQQGNSYLQGMNGFVSILGVVLAAVLYSVLPFYLLLIVIGVCYICSGISEMFIKYEEVKNEDALTIKEMFKEIGEGFSYLKSMKALMSLILIILFVNFFFTPVDSNFVPYFVRSDVAGNTNYLFNSFLTPELWGAILSVAFCLGSIIGSLILSGKKQMDKVSKFLKIQFAIFAVLALGLALSYFIFVTNTDNVNVFLIIATVLFALMGAIVSFINIPIFTAISRTCDKTMLGKISSIINIGCQGLIPLASLLAGIVIEYISNAALLFFCCGGFIIITVILLLNKKVNEL